MVNLHLVQNGIAVVAVLVKGLVERAEVGESFGSFPVLDWLGIQALDSLADVGAYHVMVGPSSVVFGISYEAVVAVSMEEVAAYDSFPSSHYVGRTVRVPLLRRLKEEIVHWDLAYGVVSVHHPSSSSVDSVDVPSSPHVLVAVVPSDRLDTLAVVDRPCYYYYLEVGMVCPSRLAFPALYQGKDPAAGILGHWIYSFDVTT